jgi:hypothetical protein
MYLHPEMKMLNGRLAYTGVQGMKDHYAKIWKSMREVLNVKRYVSDDKTAAVELHTHFDVLRDDPDSPMGPIKKGEMFDFHGVVMYQIEDGKFTDIKVCYLDFIRTGLDGKKTSLGIVH